MDILHPLNDIVEYRNRDGKLEIKVPVDCDKKELFAKIRKSFEEKTVINGDINAIRNAIMHANEEWQVVGDTLELYKDECDKFMILTTSPLSCTLLIKEELLDYGVRPTYNLVIYRLKRAGVVFGLKEDAIKEMIEYELWETPTQVAEGIEPIKGENGSIEYKVSTEAVYTPKIKENGVADYRDIQSFTQVNKGDVIAVRIPEGKGTPGTSIFGDTIPAQPGKPYELKPSKNIIVTADKNELRADAHGILINTDGILSVKNDLEIPGDVDFKIGNINFKGKVIIDGNVLPGFKIESESDILIHGQVESATIISTGASIQIEKGIIGKNNSLIKAKKSINANFAQDCKLDCDGDINIETSLLHCHVIAENINTTTAEATVIGGELIAYNSMDISSAGNSEEIPTSLKIINKEIIELIEKRKNLTTVLEQLNNIFVPLDREIRSKSKIIQKAGIYATDDHKKELQQLESKLKTITTKTKLVEKSIEAIDNELKRDDLIDGFISIRGKIYPATTIEIHKKRKSIKRVNYALKYLIVDGELAEEPINNK